MNQFFTDLDSDIQHGGVQEVPGLHAEERDAVVQRRPQEVGQDEPAGRDKGHGQGGSVADPDLDPGL